MDVPVSPDESIGIIYRMNGQDAVALIPCIFLLIMSLVGIGIFILWILSLIHAATHKMENQAVWILVIILGGPLGSLVYFIAGPYRR
jgi:hypothetical protein